MSIRRTLTLAALLALTPAPALAQTQAPSYGGPQAVVFLPDNSDEFHRALVQALSASKYFRVVRRADPANLDISADLTDTGNGGSVCLPFVGCLGGNNVKARLELRDSASGTVLRTDSCDGSSANYSTWGYWYGGFSASSGQGQAAADCAGKLVQTLINSKEIQPYLKLAPDAPTPTTRQ